MSRSLLLLLLVFVAGLTHPGWAQSEAVRMVSADVPVTDKVWTAVEEMPEFPGGQAELFKYVSRNISIPPTCKDSFSKTLLITFIISESGSPEAVEITGIDVTCTEGIVQAIASMPKWKPGRQKGKLVKVRYSLPLTICLAQQ
jgi:protein TonB